MGTKSLTSEDFFLPRRRFLLEVLRGEEVAECRLEVEVEVGSAAAVARLPTLAVRDSPTSRLEGAVSGIFAGLCYATAATTPITSACLHNLNREGSRKERQKLGTLSDAE
jgi:hypothetical protein